MPRCHQCGQRTREPHAHATRSDVTEDDFSSPTISPRDIAVPGYRISRILGAGGFGTVLAAHRQRDDLAVAIKISRHDRHSAEPRLLHEAQVLAAIGPPFVPAVYEQGTLPGRSAYVVMELIRHPTLASLLEEEAPVPATRFMDVAQALLHALAAVHRAGFTHRDLKPENIFWNRTASQITLIDFSLGRSSSTDTLDVTETGMVLGTIEYMAPEQCEPGAAIDHRADIYAIGVLLYELLTGRPPFWGAPNTVRLAHQVRRPPRLDLPVVYPVGLEAVVMRCLAKIPEQRYQSANAVSDALQSAMAESTERAPVRSGRARPRQHTAMEMPVVYFRSTKDLGAIQQALSRYGCTLANVAEDRYAAVLAELSGESPVERASMAAQGLLDMGVSTAATVDFTRVTRRVGPDGSLRHRSAAFSREHMYPEASDTGVLRTDEAERALPTRAQETLIGRDHELGRLLVDMCTAADERIPTISTVIAAGGYGKSALASRLYNEATRHFPGARVLNLRATRPLGSEGSETLRTLLRDAFSFSGMGLNALHDGQLSAILGDALCAELGPALALAMGWVEPDHPLVRDIAAAPGALRSATFRLAGEGLRRLAAHAPLLIILDDAHMADDNTLDALEHATIDGLDLPIWVCALARDTFESARPAWATRAGRRQRIALGPLEPASAAALCRELLKPAEEVPEKVVSTLVMRSQSIPLLLVELVQGLKRDRIVRQHKGNQVWFVASDELDRRTGMPLLTWLAQAELNALPEDLRAHAELAALLGDSFRSAEMAIVLQELEREGFGAEFPLDATAGLNSLRALGMLVAEPDGQLRFRHVLLREAIAQMMPPSRRRELHKASYHAYRTVHAEAVGTDNERRARLAYHADHGGMHQPAVVLYMELAEKASLSHDYITAERHYTRALDLADESDERTRMRATRGRALMRYRVGRYVDSIDDFARARELAVRIGDREAEVQILLDEATALDWSDRHMRSSKQVFRAKLLALKIPRSQLLQARLTLGVGRSYWRASRFEPSREQLEQAIALVSDLGADGYETLMDAYLSLGCVLSAQGQMERASEIFGRAVAMSEERGDLFHLAAALNNRRYIWTARDAFEEVVADAERCIAIGREIGMIGFEFSALYNVAEMFYERGDVTSAWPYARRAVRAEELWATIVGSRRPIAILLEARMHCYEGNLDEARTRWERVHEHHTAAVKARDNERQLKPSEKVLLDMVALATGPATLDEWSALVDRTSIDSIEREPVEVIEMMGIWAQRRGDSSTARECFERALGMADSVPNARKERIRSTLEQLGAPRAPSRHVRLDT